MIRAGFRSKRRAPSVTRSTSVSTRSLQPHRSGASGQIREDLGGPLTQRRIVAEHDRLDVESGQAFQAPSRQPGVVAVQLAGMAHATEPGLEVVADEQDARASGI